jgi:acyl-CoA thioester hydrolase
MDTPGLPRADDSGRIENVRHVYYCPLRWADMDSFGHVNNVTYVDYLQEARVDMLAVHAPASGGEELAEGVVVVRHEVEFLNPLEFRSEPVRIESWVTNIRAASFTMSYEILDELPDGQRRVYTKAATVLTPFVFSRERPRRIRPEEREVLDRFLEPEATP